MNNNNINNNKNTGNRRGSQQQKSQQDIQNYKDQQQNQFSPSINQNFTSIVNVHQHTNTNQNLFQSILTVITTQFQKYFPLQQQQNNLPSQGILSSITVDSKEFYQYKDRIHKGFEQYLKHKKQTLQQQFHHSINLEEVLNLCYQTVPQCYFKDNFAFDFNQFCRDIKQLNIIHHELSENLDEVEINLFYQIYNRFNEFLTVILNLNLMQNAIDDALFKIKSLKQFNQNLKSKSLESGCSIVKKKNIIMNFEKTLNILNLLKTLHKTIPTIEEHVQKGRFDIAVELLKGSEDTYIQKFKNLKALSKYKETVQNERQKLEKIIQTNFQEKSLDYVTISLNFNKNHEDQQRLDDSSFILNSQILNDTFEQGKLNVSILEEHSKNSYLSWSHCQFQREMAKEQQISKIVLQAFQFVQFSARNYRAKLMETLKNFNKQLLKDMTEYCEQILFKNNTPLGEKEDPLQLVNADLFVKLVIFYSEILKDVIMRQLYLNQTVVNNLIQRVIQEKLKQIQEYDDPQQEDDPTLFNRMKEVIEEFYQIVIHIFKFVNDKLVSLINQRKLDEETSISIFKRFNSIFTFWDSFIDKECQQLMRIPEEKFLQMSKIPRLKETIQEFNSYSGMIPLNALTNLRSDKEKIFLNSYHKIEIQKLREELETDKWIPADIPFEFYDILQYILNENFQSDNIINQQNLDQSQYIDEGDSILMLQSKKFESSNTDRFMEDETPRIINFTQENVSIIVDENEKEQEQKPVKQTLQLRIMKNEMNLNNVKFKLTNSYLVMIKMIYNYLHLVQYFKTIRNETVIKLFELLKFYNSYSTQLIIGRGGLTFEHLKRITSKNLAICSLNLSFSLEIFDPISQKIKKNFDEKAFEWIDKEIIKLKNDYLNHYNEIFNTISTILTDKMNKSCASLKELQWNNQQEKINTPTKYTAQILENMRIMYLAIEDFYNQNQLKQIFEKSMKEMNDIYLKVFKEIEINCKLGAKRIKDELEYVSQEVCKIGFMEILQDLKNEFENNIAHLIEEKCFSFIEESNQ